MDAVSTRSLTKTYQARAHSRSSVLSLEATLDLTVARWLALIFTEILFIVLTAAKARLARVLDIELTCALEPER